MTRKLTAADVPCDLRGNADNEFIARGCKEIIPIYNCSKHGKSTVRRINVAGVKYCPQCKKEK